MNILSPTWRVFAVKFIPLFASLFLLFLIIFAWNEAKGGSIVENEYASIDQPVAYHASKGTTLGLDSDSQVKVISSRFFPDMVSEARLSTRLR